jgi:hypothetical protein
MRAGLFDPAGASEATCVPDEAAANGDSVGDVVICGVIDGGGAGSDDAVTTGLVRVDGSGGAGVTAGEASDSLSGGTDDVLL